MKLTLSWALILSATVHNVQSQNSNEFMNLIKNSAIDTLPFCAEYSDEEKSSIENYVLEPSQYENNSLDEDTVTNTLVKKYFFEGKKYVHIQNLWSRDTIAVDSIDSYLMSNTFHFTNLIFKTNKVVGIIFERTEEGGSEIYFCTFDKEGKLISKIQIAFYMHSGSYTTDDGGRAPWYAEKNGCVNKDLTISTNNGQGKPRKYRILNTGKIIEIK